MPEDIVTELKSDINYFTNIDFPVLANKFQKCLEEIESLRRQLDEARSSNVKTAE